MTVPTIGSSLKQGDAAGPQIRLLVCAQCKTIDELPDFNGPPEHDVVLTYAIENNHTDRLTGLGHLGGQLFKVPVQHWANPEVQAKTKKQISEGTRGLDEVDNNFYDTRSTFYDDAMKCFGQHKRPKGACGDYKSDSKRLLPNTNKERKDLGLAKVSETGPKVWLCQFCPVSAYYLTRERAAAGVYDK